ncbi:phosphonoacetaldehyde hydrolase-like [Diadema setosum]|uniref:phosphonoacetaldehyde hydrolase-like n=1 Tax=Diadema setosum TaxID=31175 RepID=UPI003B3AE855
MTPTAPPPGDKTMWTGFSSASQPKYPVLWTNPQMEYRKVYQYRGRVKMIVFDWAGTVVDCGVFAPVRAFTNVFKSEGIQVLDEEVRAPMGAHKRAHIAQMLEMDRISRLWKEKHGKPATTADIDRMYSSFVPEQIKALAQHAGVIKGIPDTVQCLRDEYQLKIGTSTGFPSQIMEHLVPMAAQQGFEPDFCATADKVKEARPTPNMLFLNMMELNINPVEAVVKVDDTVSGIMEGLSGGCWTVGVAKTGNYMGATETELLEMPQNEYASRVKHAYKVLIDSGAHYVIDSVRDILPVIDDINRRLSIGEKP